MKKLVFTVLMILVASSAIAQTPPTVTFAASADHNTVVGTTPVVASYAVDVWLTTASGPALFTVPLGKPSPVNGNITAPVPQFLGRANGVYIGQAAATGPGGTSRSQFSDPFPLITGAPAAPGKPSFSQE